MRTVQRDGLEPFHNSRRRQVEVGGGGWNSHSPGAKPAPASEPPLSALHDPDKKRQETDGEH